MEKITDEELAKRVKELVASPEFKRDIEEALKRSDEAIRKLKEARKVHWWQLMRPVDI